MIQIYGIKNCNSVKKAILFFKNNNLEYNLNDFKENQVDCEKVSFWLKNIDINTLFNSRSTTYKKHSLKELNLSDDDKKVWLCRENLLIKRPVLEYKNLILIGFDENKYMEIFQQRS